LLPLHYAVQFVGLSSQCNSIRRTNNRRDNPFIDYIKAVLPIIGRRVLRRFYRRGDTMRKATNHICRRKRSLAPVGRRTGSGRQLVAPAGPYHSSSATTLKRIRRLIMHITVAEQLTVYRCLHAQCLGHAPLHTVRRDKYFSDTVQANLSHGCHQALSVLIFDGVLLVTGRFTLNQRDAGHLLNNAI